MAEKKVHMTKVFKMVQQHTCKPQLQQKRYFDCNRRGEFHGFEEVELVMVLVYSRVGTGKRNKKVVNVNVML